VNPEDAIAAIEESPTTEPKPPLLRLIDAEHNHARADRNFDRHLKARSQLQDDFNAAGRELAEARKAYRDYLDAEFSKFD
jgi:hypothetical protein